MQFKTTLHCATVSHLAYADDILIFTQASSRAIRRLKTCLANYEMVSGQQISLPKSNFYIAETHEDWVESIQDSGGFARGSFPFMYLGVPIYRGAKRTDMFLFLREKIARRISGWAHRHLSFGGRLTLIKSTLEAIPIHTFQAIEPTSGAIKQLEQQLARFFWGATNERKRTHWISWEQICLPVAEGGLGVRSFREVLRAFNMKLWWRFREQNSLWAAHLHSKYCRKASPLTNSISSRSRAHGGGSREPGLLPTRTSAGSLGRGTSSSGCPCDASRSDPKLGSNNKHNKIRDPTTKIESKQGRMVD